MLEFVKFAEYLNKTYRLIDALDVKRIGNYCSKLSGSGQENFILIKFLNEYLGIFKDKLLRD